MRYMRLPGRAVRVGDEALGGQAGPAEVAAGELHAREVQLAGHAGGHRPQPVVEHVGCRCSATGRPIGTVPAAGMPRSGSCHVTSTAASVGP